MSDEKVAIIGKYYDEIHGGIENNTKQIAEALSDEYEVKVIAMRRGIGRGKEETIDGIEVCKLPSIGNIWSQELVFGLNKELKEFNPDIIHFQAPNPLLAICLDRYISRKDNDDYKLIISHHADLEKPKILRMLFNWGYRDLLEKSDRIIAYTSVFIENSREISDYSDKAEVIPHGTECPDWVLEETESRIEEQNLFNDVKKKIGFLGRLREWKGVENLIDALENLPEDFVLGIGGEGEERKKLEKMVEEKDLDDRVSFHGWIEEEEKWNFLLGLDTLVLPSISEGESFGQVLVEAQLTGTVTIASDLPTGVREVLGEEDFGFLVEPGDSQEISKALENLEDEEKSFELAKKAYHNALNNYTASKCKEKIKKLYDKIKD